MPDLGRFTRTAAFERLQAAAASWVDHNVELIESGAQWLDGAGRHVVDRCETRWGMRGAHPLVAASEPPGVTCDREVTVVYGLDGSLPARLTDLAAVLAVAGWGRRDGDTTIPIRDLHERDPPLRDVSWSPVPGNGYPAGLTAMPPERRFSLERWISMGIGWADGGLPAEQVIARLAAEPLRPVGASPVTQPVEMAGADIGDLAARALAGHKHVIAIRISLCYYLNANASARPGRLGMRLLGVREARRQDP